MHTEEQIREILERYIKGECTDQEISFLEKWYESAEAKDSGGILNEEDMERLAERLRNAIAEKMQAQHILVEKPKNRPRVFFLRPFGRVAAVWIGLIVVGGWCFLQWNKRSKHIQLQAREAMTEVATDYGEMKKIKLPDSSVVWLNSATRLAYHADFAQNRELQLTGEAFFEVVHDTGHPFIVHAGNASTVVYGTAFNISAYPATGQLRISLQRGKIGVTYENSMRKASKILTPGQLLIYDKQTESDEVMNQLPGEMDEWTTGRLLFYRTPLKEALAQLEARYGVHIIYDRVLKNQTITARFENTALEKVLEHLSFGWDLHFIRKGDTLHVK